VAALLPLRGRSGADGESRIRDAASKRRMTMVTVRLIVSPPLGADAHEAFQHAASSSLLTSVSDPDVNASFLSVRAAQATVASVVREIVERIGASSAPGRAFRLELQSLDPASAFSDELLRTIAVDVHGILRCSTYVNRRLVPVSAWAKQRAMGWSSAGLTLGATASPSLPFGGSESIGLAIEAGANTVIVKVRLVGAALHAAQLEAIANSAGGGESGFVEVGAYPLGSRKDTSSIVLLELGDVKRTPLHRVLEVVEIEGRRFGTRLGCGALLSDAPLELFMGALAMHMGLALTPAQVIETHLSQAVAP
jgi:hypothetical protein